MTDSAEPRRLVLGKPNAAPRNRTIMLTDDDRRRLGRPMGLPGHEIENPADAMEGHVICADALDALAMLPTDSVDLILADPPYLLAKPFGTGTIRLERGAYREWTGAWIAACARVLSETGSIYVCCDWRISGMIHEIMEDRFQVRNRITWKRDKGRGARANWKNNMEDIWFATRGRTYTFNLEDVKLRKTVIAPYREGGVGGTPKDWIEDASGERYRYTCPSNIWTDLCVPFWSMPENTPHPTQKPEKLVERIVRASSNPGDRVLDPFLGSGTTAVVARRLGRRWIGIEKNPDFALLAMKRLALSTPKAS